MYAEKLGYCQTSTHFNTQFIFQQFAIYIFSYVTFEYYYRADTFYIYIMFPAHKLTTLIVSNQINFQ